MQQGYHSITMWTNSSSPANFPKAEGSKSVPGVKIVHATTLEQKFTLCSRSPK